MPHPHKRPPMQRDMQPDMRPESRNDTRPDTAPTPRPNRPPPRPHGWAEPEDDPILDAARVPLSSFRENKPTHSAYVVFIWLRLLRPLLMIAFWVAVALYTWRHFFRTTDDLGDASLLGLYAVLVAMIFALMLILGPVRRGIRSDEDRHPGTNESTAFAVADYARLDPRRLFGWRRARRLVVRHNRAGELRDAADMDIAEEMAAMPPERRRARR